MTEVVSTTYFYGIGSDEKFVKLNDYENIRKENEALKQSVAEGGEIIAELKAQIEKMKCCANCSHKFEPREKGGYVMPCEATEYKPCDRWELKK